MWLCAALACGLCGALAAASTAAGAAAGAYRQFGAYGSGAGQFDEPFGIAVDDANGMIYVLDTNNQRIEEFTSEGVFERAWGWGVAGDGRQALEACTSACVPGARGQGPGQFGFAEGIAVDNDPRSASYGDLYIADLSNHRVQKFSPTGSFLLMFGAGVNETASERHEGEYEDVCPVHPGDVCTGGTPGAGPSQLEFPVEGHVIAVGPTGTVYVGDRDRIQEFAPDGIYESQVRITQPAVSGEGEVGGVSGVEVNAAGDLYVVRIGVRDVNEYEPSGRFLRSLDVQQSAENPEGPTPVVTLDSAGDAFIEQNYGPRYAIAELDEEGAPLATLATPAAAGLHGIVYDNRTGALYVLDLGSGEAPVLVLAPPDPGPFAAGGSGLARWLIPDI